MFIVKDWKTKWFKSLCE